MKRLSLKQLRVIEALIECQSAVKAAEKLNISSAAISYTLKQIKNQLGLNLFYRTREGLRPYPPTIDIYVQHKDILDLNQKQRDLVVATYSLTEMILTEHFSKEQNPASDAKFIFTPMGVSNEQRLCKLLHHEVDIDIGSELVSSNSIISKRLFTSPLCIIASKEHHKSKKRITLDEWLKSTHLSWLRGIDNIVDLAAKVDSSLLDRRNVVWSSPDLLALVNMCATSDHIMLMPEMFVETLQKHFPIQSFRCPVEIAMVFDCYIHYRKSIEDQVNMWELQNAF